MKATELMIGDWVRVPSELNRYMRIRSTFDMDSAILYEPIPLTPEILEKNGFIKDADKDDMLADMYHLLVHNGLERESFTIQVNLYREPICGVSTLVKCWGRIPPLYGGLNDIHLCSANYVHQLQHAFRLCGIQKQIEL